MKGISLSIIGEMRACINLIDDRPLIMLSNILTHADCVFLAGSGRGADTARIFARRMTALGKEVHIAGEATAPAIRRGDVMIIFASAQDTRSMALIAKKAYQAEATIAVFSPTASSPIADLASIVIPITRPEPDLIASQQTASVLFDQVCMVLADTLAVQVSKKMNMPYESLMRNGGNFE